MVFDLESCDASTNLTYDVDTTPEDVCAFLEDLLGLYREIRSLFD
jgi:hypothetical protein